MEPKQTCSECDNPIEAEALTGLCPVCMMRVGMGSVETSPAGQGDVRQFTPPSVQDLAGLFPQLDIEALIGVGGMGAVYKAHQRDLDRPVALKILVPRSKSDPGFVERFMREARALARLSHPHIVAVYDFGHKDALNYFIMEFVDGANLREIQKAGTLSSDQALAIIPQICEALQFAHNEGVVHRDIKPENVLLDQKGRVKIADFGLAKIVGKQTQNLTLTQAGYIMGTPHYMAPEQVEHPHEVDHRADIYSLGVVFYEMLTGELPLGKFDPPSHRVQVDVRLDEVVLKTLEKEPQRRYQQVSQVRTEVETIVSTASELQADRRADEKRVSEQALDDIRQSLRMPAFGLLLSGSLNLAVLCLLALSVGPSMLGSQSFSYTALELTLFVPLLFCLVGVVLWGSSCMRRLTHHRVCIDAAVVAILFSGGSGIGLIFGIWALVVLSRKEVRDAFQQVRIVRSKAGPLEPRFSHTAIVGAIWPVLLVGSAFLVLPLQWSLTKTASSGLAWWRIVLMVTVLPLGLAAPFGTTILGWISVNQIRRSAGRLYGLWLAVGDGLLFPLLLLDTGVVWLWLLLENEGSSLWHMGRLENLFFMSLTILLSNVLIISSVWHGLTRRAESPVHRGYIWMRRLGMLLLIAVIAGGLVIAHAQRDCSMRDGIGEESPDGLYSLTAQTRWAMRMLDGDELLYFIQVQGRGGAVFEQWRMPVPTAKLAQGYYGTSPYSLIQQGRIEWSADSRTVRLLVRDVEVFEYTTP